MLWGRVSSGLVLGAMIWSLAACAKVSRELQHFPEIFNPPVNLVEPNYTAADVLVAGAKPALRVTTPIATAALEPTNLLPGEKTSAFGKVMIDQVATRFTQLGYKIQTHALSISAAANETQADALARAEKDKAAMLLTGSYMISPYDVLVNVRLIDVAGGHVVSSTDYRVPLGSDTYELLGRDPYMGVPHKPKNNPEEAPKTAPMKWSDLPVKVVD